MKKENEIKWVLDSEVTEEYPPSKSTMKTHANNITNLEGTKEKPTLEELQEKVGGDIEIAFRNNEVQIIIDEEGKLKGKEINMGATEHWFTLLRESHRAQYEEYGPHTLEEFIRNVDFLVGHVVFLHKGAMID
tara:strand:+ start:6106 stop:6504 length:399 start_codon:yes stop_codon:yes gene_type:complete